MERGRINLKIDAVLFLYDSLTEAPADTAALRVLPPPGGQVLRKPDGCFVLMNCPKPPFSVTVESPFYETERLTFGKAEQTAAESRTAFPVRTCFLIRNSVLPLPAGAAALEGRAEPGARMLACLCSEEQKLRLTADYEAGGEKLALYCPQGKDLTGRLFYLCSGEGHGALISLVEQEKPGIYRLELPIRYSFPKVGSMAYPVSAAVCGADGRFRLLFRHVPPEGCGCIFLSEGNDGCEETGRLQILPGGRNLLQ